MKKIETNIKDLYVIKPDVYGDDRGWFMETYNEEKFKELGLNYTFIQDNHSFSKEKGVLRGLHAQLGKYSQAKLIRCTKGKILDVAVDIRKDSDTYLKYFSVELSEENKAMLLIPRDFLHGFITLTDDVEVQYKVDNVYNKDSEVSVIYNDDEIGIDWTIKPTVLSDKDRLGIRVKDIK